MITAILTISHASPLAGTESGKAQGLAHIAERAGTRGQLSVIRWSELDIEKGLTRAPEDRQPSQVGCSKPGASQSLLAVLSWPGPGGYRAENTDPDSMGLCIMS